MVLYGTQTVTGIDQGKATCVQLLYMYIVQIIHYSTFPKQLNYFALYGSDLKKVQLAFWISLFQLY